MNPNKAAKRKLRLGVLLSFTGVPIINGCGTEGVIENVKGREMIQIPTSKIILHPFMVQ